MIAVCVATRGLIHTRTMQSIFDGINFCGFDCKLYTTHNLPIPDSQNKLVDQALSDGADRLFFIEEDMFLFPQAFKAMCESEGNIVTLQYNDKNGSPHGIIHYNELGEIIWAGLGATIIDREVFEKIGQPYFRIDVLYKNVKKYVDDLGRAITQFEELPPISEWDSKQNKFVKKVNNYKYGGQDINFYTRARECGYTIMKLDDHKAHHFQLVKLGEPHINNGCHVIKEV